jgi:tetratricopeptide (TPR) repeat protein
MAEKDEEYEFEIIMRDSSHRGESTEEESTKKGSTSSGENKQKENYLDVVNIIESLMQNEDFPLKNGSSLTISKIISFLNKEIYENKNFTEAWLIKGTVLYKTGKYNGAIDAFDGALETMQKEISEEKMDTWIKNNGTSYRYALKLKAFSLCKLGRYREALNALDEISVIYPSDPEIESDKAMLQTIENERLIRKTDKAQDHSSTHPGTWERRGKSSYEMGNYEEALKEFSRCLESNPKDAAVWKNKGSALYMLDRYEEALEAFDNSLEINPRDANAWSFKGSILYKIGKPEEALKILDKALQKNPNIFEAWFNKGSILFELGRYKQASSAVENALRINAEDVNALNLKNSNWINLRIMNKQTLECNFYPEYYLKQILKYSKDNCASEL